ncbi:MAG: transglutaminase-like domain-containing protein [Candidatus Dojkabacteria bacterium]|jgi:transglutaminase-like putative cysteine protease|nr:transglutaminase-like domain-containing protein [Candidatus Dojkabacteria bacterium]
MEMYKLLRKTFLFLPLLLLFFTKVDAVTYDFEFINTTTVNYTTGKDYVEVDTQFLRKVNNREYLFSTKGEKIFHIPDSSSGKDYEIELERQYKLDSLEVTSNTGSKVPYTVEELELGQGIYINVPNYKTTTYGSVYVVNLNYKTHIYVRNVKDWVAIQVPALHEDTQFTQKDEVSGTTTKIEYNLDLVVDSGIAPLSKIYPSTYTTSNTKDSKTTYSFKGEDRVGIPVYLEFGTARVFRFEINLKAPKTDNIVPEKYSFALSALSTNIYQVPLPREFAETNQRVMIEEIYPKPSKVTIDLEGNVVGTFEVPANKDNDILISGYIWLEQDEYENMRSVPNLKYSEYRNLVKNDSKLSQYLLPTKYWESTDSFIQSKASELVEEKEYFLDVIRSTYGYINEVLEYDNEKAESSNERIGAKAALQGGASVCMEYSDSMIALLRAQGIPSRAAVGYIGIEEKTDDDNVPHQWVQVWVPEYGWLSIDPSYESVNMQIGTNLDSVLWESFFSDDDTNLGVYTADSIDLDTFTKENYSIQVYAVEQKDIPETDTLLSYSDIASEQEDMNVKDTLNILVKTTTIGKAFIIILPILVVLILLILLLSLITVLIRRAKSQRISPNQQP